MKFVVLFKKYFLSTLLFIILAEEIIAAKLDKKETLNQIGTKAPIIPNKTYPESLNSIKTIELITLPNKKKFSISSKDIKVKQFFFLFLI